MNICCHYEQTNKEEMYGNYVNVRLLSGADSINCSFHDSVFILIHISCISCTLNGVFHPVGQLTLPQGHELALNYIIERKRMDDLVSSCIDGRFKEQKVDRSFM